MMTLDSLHSFLVSARTHANTLQSMQTARTRDATDRRQCAVHILGPPRAIEPRWSLVLCAMSLVPCASRIRHSSNDHVQADIDVKRDVLAAHLSVALRR